MIKKKKTNNPKLGNIYCVELADQSYTVSQICHVFEIDGFYSVAMAFFPYRFQARTLLDNEYSAMDLSNPFAVISVTQIPSQAWNMIGNKAVYYSNFNIDEQAVGEWGWLDHTERDTNWILEMYFGIYPWDAFADRAFMDKLLLSNHNRPVFARDRSEFQTKELAALGILVQ